MSESSILIIAAERGLGLGLTEQFLARGWDVFATALPSSDVTALQGLANTADGRLHIGYIDVADADHIDVLQSALGEQSFDVIFLNAGIYGPLHQSVMEATGDEVQQIMTVNAFGPVRLARHLLSRLKERGALAFMTSHRASIAGNLEGGLELYRASKAALNILSRGLYAEVKDKGHTVLSIHPGWVATAMGTLDGTVEAEIDVITSVCGVADVVELHRHSGEHLYLDYQGQSIAW